MAKHRVGAWVRSSLVGSLLGLSLGHLLLSSIAQAQIVPDGTLGTQAIPFTLGACGGTGGNCFILNGTQRGANLFHSFQQFSLPNPTDGAVFFTDPATQNVIVRVTGIGQPFISNINGTIQTSNPANFFLLNPNGIVFGPGARLLIGGSFLATTAERMLFQDGTVFDTRDQTVAPLLTVSVPVGLQFGSTPGSINSGMQIGAGLNSLFTDFALVGGNVNFTGSNILAPGRNIEIGSITEPGTVGIVTSGNPLSLRIPDGISRGDVSITNQSSLEVQADNRGNIAIYARNLNISETSVLNAGIFQGLGTIASQAGDITLDATGAINLRQSGFVNSLVQTNATGNGSNINVKAESLSMSNDSGIVARVQGQGNAGNISIQVRNLTSLEGVPGSPITTRIATNVEPGGTGNSGNIFLETGSLSIFNNAQISTNSFGVGNTGNITITARDSILISGSNRDGIFSRTGTGVTGNAGDITITTGSLSATNGAVLSSTTSGRGDAGNLTINARNNVIFDGTSAAGSSVRLGGFGSGGNLIITADSLSILNGSGLNIGLFGNGNAGEILIQARAIEVSGRSVDGILTSQISTDSDGGAAGNVTIVAEKLRVWGGGLISTNARGQGRGGDIIINATESVELVGPDTLDLSRLQFPSFIRTGTVGAGAAGNLTVTTNRLSVRNGAGISTSALSPFSTGRGGNLTINASDRVEIGGSIPTLSESQSAILTDTSGGADAGNLKITTRHLVIRDGGIISTGTQNLGRHEGDLLGRGGDLDINASESIEVSGATPGGEFRSTLRTGTITAGTAGNLRINTKRLSVQDRGQVIAATFGSGNAGNLEVNASELVEIVGDNSINSLSTSTLATESLGTGNAGNMYIQTGKLVLQDRAVISSRALRNLGQGGDLQITALDSIDLSGSGISSNTLGTGDAGNLTISTGRLTLRNGSQVNSGTLGQGAGGDLTVNATELVEIGGIGSDGFNSRLFTETFGDGNAGDLTINTSKLVINNAGNISASTLGRGNGGNLTVNATESVEAIGLAPNTLLSALAAAATSSGNAGNLTITTRRLTLRDGVTLTSQSLDQGQAGNITINVRNALSAHDSSIFTSALQSSGGAIKVNAGSIRLQGNSDIITSVFRGAGGGGDITLNARSIIALGDSDILAFAQDGRGGNITLNTPVFFGQNYRPAPPGTNPLTLNGNNRVDINASGATSGIISLPDQSFLQNRLSELPQNLIDTNRILANSCIVRDAAAGGTFIVTGTGGLPVRPGDAPLPAFPTGEVQSVAADGRTDETDRGRTASASSVSNPLPEAIAEAQGFYKLPDGQIILSWECGNRN